MAPSLPIILVEGILDGDDRVFLDVGEVEISELGARNPLLGVGVGVLEVKVVLAVPVELGRSDVKSNLDAALIACLLDGLSEKLKRLLGTRDIRRETTLITDIDG